MDPPTQNATYRPNGLKAAFSLLMFLKFVVIYK